MHSSTRSGAGRKKAWERARVQGGSKHSLGRGRGVQGGTKAVPPFVGVSVHPGDTRMSRVERIIVLGSCGSRAPRTFSTPGHSPRWRRHN